MNKSYLTKALGKEYDLPLRKAEEIVDVLFQAMSKALIDGDRIEIRGFGSFTVKEYEGYPGRNPKTGEILRVKPKKLPSFKAGDDLVKRLKICWTVSSRANLHMKTDSIHVCCRFPKDGLTGLLTDIPLNTAGNNIHIVENRAEHHSLCLTAKRLTARRQHLGNTRQESSR